jgi:Lar family restriction alleviation protein
MTTLKVNNKKSKEVKNMVKEVIYSCPFCGYDEVQLCRTNENACWVRCDSCGADAESHAKRKNAIENWNRRASMTQATIIEDDELEG